MRPFDYSIKESVNGYYLAFPENRADDAKIQSHIKSASADAQSKIATVRGHIAREQEKLVKAEITRRDEISSMVTHAAINLATGAMAAVHASGDTAYEFNETDATVRGEAKISVYKNQETATASSV